jgi:transglutaminase-like putative cysteine protease
MKIYILFFAASLCLLLNSCSADHLITDEKYRLKVENDFSERESLAEGRKDQLFDIFDEKLSERQVEAMKFLFAYMPLSDLADYTGQFFLANADLSLKTLSDRKWGKQIPEQIFLHYVLPLRVNNENLDSFRIVYYNEISDRIKGMTAADAALEINHWCHEKVAYQPADIRTSGPMSTILSARGRCGEESTFTVAALRTAGLPARQVYTPRWAHTDDNHAWVEVWIEGKWYYMGACEPEPVLDRGWFTEPARRAMLVHTKSFGAPSGEDNVIISSRNYSYINNLSKYADTKRLFVRVTDKNDLPVSDAKVEYRLYNYAEFYPLATVPTDTNGISSFETGLGDLMVWAYKGSDFNFAKISVSHTDTLFLTLNRNPLREGYLEFDLAVPPVRTPFAGPSEDLITANAKRVENENKLRESYISSWMKPSEAVNLAISAGVDSLALKEIIKRSMGNYKSVASFIASAPADERKLAVKLLTLVADKDLRDTPERILNDHLKFVPGFDRGKGYDEEIYFNYVLNPRIANELILPWRGYLQEKFGTADKSSIIANPSVLADLVTERIKINDADNYYDTPITPIGVDQLGVSDTFSRDIYYVAICRSLGIPARLEQGTGKPQYYSGGKWNDAQFGRSTGVQSARGFLKLTSSEKQIVPEYYIHFTLARFEGGRYNTLNFDYNRKITDFRDELALLPGYYMLVTGNRVSDSGILSSITFFELKENEHKSVKVSLRKAEAGNEILGKFDLEKIITLPDKTNKKLKELSSKGIVLIWIEPESEPAKHVLNDLPLLKDELNKWGGWFVFILPSPGDLQAFNTSSFKGLPANSLFVSDKEMSLFKEACGSLSCSSARLPLIILAGKNGDIIYKSEGYTIGAGGQILKKVKDF